MATKTLDLFSSQDIFILYSFLKDIFSGQAGLVVHFFQPFKNDTNELIYKTETDSET